MNSSVFLQVARLSLTAGWMILVLLALRPLLKKAPRRFSCLLWGLVAVRLALPFSFESRVSMVPQAAAAPQKIAQALNPGQVMWVNPAALAANPLPAAQAAPPAFSPASLIPLVWGLGIAAMLLYAAISYFRLYRQVRISAPAGKRVYRCDTISSPFILGVFHPKIYLPSDLDQQSTPSVLAHEQAHLRRGDHLWKPLGYVLLSIYWFNPLCWVAYFLFCRDVEQACDEAVIASMNPQQKKDYSAALLACAAPNRMQVCPLAFAEVGVKQRIAGVLNYRKPKFWVVALTTVLCVSLTAGLLTDPVKAEGKTGSEQVLHHSPSDAAACVAKEKVNVRQMPTKQSKVVGSLAQGEQVTVIRTDLIADINWSYVQYGTEERTGWVVSEYLDTGDTAPIAAVAENAAPQQVPSNPPMEGNPTVMAREKLNVRQDPTTQSKTVGTLAQGEQVMVIRTDLIADVSWSYVQYGTEERKGWVLSEYLDTGDTAPIAAVAENAAPQQVPSNPPMEGNPTVMAREKLNVRQDPTTQSKTVGTLAQGEQVMVIRTDLIADVSWSYVQYGTEERKGWVLSEYLDTGDTTPIAAVAENPAPQQAPTSAPIEKITAAIAKENLNVRQAPSVQSKAVGLLLKGEQVTVLRTDLFENVSWSYVQYGTEKRVGWVISEYLTADDSIAQDGPLSLTAALEYFQRYIQAIALDTPDKAEGFLYFATEYSREFFRDNYAPVTGWDITAISQLADDLCCIAWSSPSSTDYAFVGQMDGRLYVFRTVHELPEHWKAGLDVAQYEQENAMYMTEALLECYAVTKRLMEFAQPVQVKITQKDGWKPAETPWELDFADAVCGTDTWHFTQEISDKTPQCTILLTAEDGSTARLWDVDGTVLITHPDGTQEICIADFQGEATYEGSSLLSTVYQWATNLA